ncbi:MAG: translation initiation factor IF-3 [Verrucomicrobia bacterium]|nr:MAG: translation initiation factor IF-3 [Verrucomicrobiota bacterium]
MRVNGKIRAREVRVIGVDGAQLGILSLGDALTQARSHGVDLVEVAPNANPPVCRLVDFGKYRYEQNKRDKDSKKHQHATKVKEIQLSPKIDPHDLGVKIGHAVGFLCEDMKVKVTLKFRGREMQHTEVGFQVIQKFIGEIAPYGHQDFEPKLIGRGIHLMISPLPRNKRARNPYAPETAPVPERVAATSNSANSHAPVPVQVQRPQAPSSPAPKGGNFVNNPFAQLEVEGG